MGKGQEPRNLRVQRTKGNSEQASEQLLPPVLTLRSFPLRLTSYQSSLEYRDTVRPLACSAAIPAFLLISLGISPPLLPAPLAHSLPRPVRNTQSRLSIRFTSPPLNAERVVCLTRSLAWIPGSNHCPRHLRRSSSGVDQPKSNSVFSSAVLSDRTSRGSPRWAISPRSSQPLQSCGRSSQSEREALGNVESKKKKNLLHLRQAPSPPPQHFSSRA